MSVYLSRAVPYLDVAPCVTASGQNVGKTAAGNLQARLHPGEVFKEHFLCLFTSRGLCPT